MPLLLTNEEVTRVLSMADCMAPMETAFRELGNGQAVSRPRSDLVVPDADPARHYLLKTCDAALPGAGLSAVRVTSNMMQEFRGEGTRRLDPLPLAGGGKGYVGLVFLFDMQTLELVGIIQDARIQVMRAGAAHGIAAKYLARKNAEVLGVLGSGNQAREQLSAIALVRKLSKVKVYSPTRANRDRFVREMSDRLGLDIVGCDTIRDVVKGSDLVAATTTSLVPLFPGDWLEPGQHVSAVRATEMDDVARDRAALLVLQSREQSLLWTPSATRPEQGSWYQARNREIDASRLALLPDIVAGHHPGRASQRDITLLGAYASFGPGTGYSALGAIALKRARERGIGRELPAEWFVQKESS